MNRDNRNSKIKERGHAGLLLLDLVCYLLWSVLDFFSTRAQQHNAKQAGLLIRSLAGEALNVDTNSREASQKVLNCEADHALERVHADARLPSV